MQKYTASHQTTERLFCIDAAKTAGIFLVILFHRQGIQTTSLQIVGASFHVPIFFFVYGMVSSGADKHGLGSVVMRNFSSLIIPYLLWVTIYGNYWTVTSPVRCWLYTLWGSNLAITRAGSNAVLWFLPAMFIASSLFALATYVLRKLLNTSDTLRASAVLNTSVTTKPNTRTYACELCFVCAGLVIGRLLSLNTPPYGYPLSLDIGFVGFAFMMMGRTLRPFIMGLTGAPWYQLVLSFCVSSGVCCACALNNGVRAVVALGIFGNYLLFYLSSVMGCVALVLAGSLLERLLNWGGQKFAARNYAVQHSTVQSSIGTISRMTATISSVSVSTMALRAIAYVGKHSLFFFAGHYLAFSVLGQVLNAFRITLPTAIAGDLMYATLAILLCLGPCAVAFRFAPILEGKTQQRS